MSCIYLNERSCSLYNAICNIPPSKCKDYKHPLGLHPRMDWSTINEEEATDMKKIFNKGPAADIAVNPDCCKKYPFMTTCENGIYKSTAQNDYVSILEKFINNLYPEENFGFFGFDAVGAEQRVLEDAKYKGYNEDMVTKAFVKTVNNFRTEHNSVYVRFHTFCMEILLREPHKNYEEKYPFEFRFILTLILGYLNKLDSVAIINCDNPETYFLDKIANVKVPELTQALNHTKVYVKESNALVLAEGMRKVEAWFKTLPNKFIPPRELTVAEIEKQLGYKIKIVGDDK